MNLESAREYIASAGSALTKATSLASGDAQFFATAPKVDDLRVALASASAYEKRDAMKRITAQMCRGVNMRHMFPDVVKNIHVPSIELRKLIYLYVVNYAEECPDEALLSISAFQKDLVDSSVHVRSLALRMLCSIRIPAIHPAVMVAVRKCASDTSALVRKTAAIGLYQMYVVCRAESDRASMHTLLAKLMADDHPDVAGAAAMSFSRICPNTVELVHPVYRHWCRLLSACEEVAQVIILRILLRYARTQFCDPCGPVEEDKGNTPTNDGGHTSNSSATSSSASSFFYDDADGKGRPGAKGDRSVALHPDHLLLLNTVKPLLLSLNKAVVIAACAVLVHCGTAAHIDLCVPPLLRLHMCTKEGQSVILHVIYSLLLKRPHAFVPFVKSFYVLPNDGPEVRQLKLQVLSHLVTTDNMSEVAQEYRSYIRSYEVDAVVEAVRGISVTAIRNPAFYTYAIRLLPPLFSHKSSQVVSESVNVLRLLVMQGKNSVQTTRLIVRLMHDAIQARIASPHALATVLWLVGQKMDSHTSMATAAPDLFRVFVKSFATETPEVKREVLYLGCRIWVRLEGTGDLAQRFKKLYLHVLDLARFDENYSIREEARLLETGVDRQSESFAAFKATLLGDIPLPHAADPFADRDQYELGTLSHLCGRSVLGYRPLPPWPTVMPDPSTRAIRSVAAAKHAKMAAGGGFSSSTGSSASGGAESSEEDFYASHDDSSDAETYSRSSTRTDSSTGTASHNGSEDGGEAHSSDSDDHSDAPQTACAATRLPPAIVIKRVQTSSATTVEATVSNHANPTYADAPLEKSKTAMNVVGTDEGSARINQDAHENSEEQVIDEETKEPTEPEALSETERRL